MAWPSGVCDDGTQVPTPVGELCANCDELIEPGHQGSFMGNGVWPERPALVPVHKECALRAVVGGIGHLRDHAYWCLQEHDPDAAMSYRQSSLAVWDWAVSHR
jgi:hypothetical protein